MATVGFSERIYLQYLRTKFKTISKLAPATAGRMAFDLFCTPYPKYKKRKAPAIFHQALKRTVVLSDQTKLHGFEWLPNKPNDQTVLIAHGYASYAYKFEHYIAPLLKMGYRVLAFDAPAHGKSKGNSSIMTEFIASILEIDKQYGPFEFAIGHSLGGMSVLNAIKQNLQVKKAVIIGSGDIIQDIIDDFIGKLKLKPEYGVKLKDHFEAKFGGKMNDYSAYKAAEKTEIPVLIVHDKDDDDVSVKAAYHIQKHLKNSEIMITEGLGHRKILGDDNVTQKIIEFIK